MKFKDYIKGIISARKAMIEDTRKKIKSSEDVNEVRALGERLQELMAELADAEAQLAEAERDDSGKSDDSKDGNDGKDGEGEGRKFNPLGAFQMRGAEPPADTDKRSTMEYRKAFMAYVQRGEKSDLLKRTDYQNESSDLGVLLPNTVVQEIIKGVEGVYGQLYSRVKKTNVKGGVQYPIGAFSANLVWGGTAGTDAENGVSSKQDAGGVTAYVEFTYHIGEIRIAQSLLQTVLSVEVFEKEIVKAIVEAYVKAMDTAILDGTGTNQPTGIFADTTSGIQRITALTGHVIEFSPKDMEDWKSWQKNFFAKIPLGMRKLSPQFVMTANTFEANIETLEDSNGQPVARNIFNPVSGAETATFKGKEVVFIEEGTSIENFDDASTGDYFGIYWVPEKAYAINTNLEFGYKKYFDEDTNQWITKALVIVDGKILDPNYIFLLKKKANA